MRSENEIIEVLEDIQEEYQKATAWLLEVQAGGFKRNLDLIHILEGQVRLYHEKIRLLEWVLGWKGPGEK